MCNNKAAVFILMGQSNAVGHGVPMCEEDIIKEPRKNVFGLDRTYNQSYENRELVWTGYTSFGMNLAEKQDNTYSVANCLATLWQEHIDKGNEYGLPDLYIVHIAIGAQGVTEKYMWYPKREKKMIPGELGTVDISLFPFSQHIFSLLDDSFQKLGKDYEIIGLHWRGGEEDAGIAKEVLESTLEDIYTEMFDEYNRILKFPPIILHRIVCKDRCLDGDPTGKSLEGMYYIDSIFDKLEQKYDNISVFDVRTAPQYIPDVRGNGLYIEDVVHFTPEVNTWVASQIIEKYVKK